MTGGEGRGNIYLSLDKNLINYLIHSHRKRISSPGIDYEVPTVVVGA